MLEVATTDAKTHFSELLDQVERGETVIITRNGRRIARIVPEMERRQQDIEDAIGELKSLGKEIRERCGPMMVEEILLLRHEGHRY